MSTWTHTRRLPAQRTGKKGIFKSILAFEGLYRQRRALAHLDEAALRDMGISRADAEKEAQRHLWDAPHHWRR